MRAFVVLMGLAVAACNQTTFGRASIANEARESLIGKSKGEILACMGAPVRSVGSDGIEVLTYGSLGGDVRTFGQAEASRFGNQISASGYSRSITRSCEIDIVLGSGRVSRVNYRGRTGGLLTGGEACAAAVENCVGGH